MASIAANNRSALRNHRLPPNSLPVRFTLGQNYPNPFNPATTFRYVLSESNVRLSVYNMIGKEVTTLVDGVMPAGENEVEWSASYIASGTCVYQIEVASMNDPSKILTGMKKMLLVKQGCSYGSEQLPLCDVPAG